MSGDLHGRGCGFKWSSNVAPNSTFIREELRDLVGDDKISLLN